MSNFNIGLDYNLEENLNELVEDEVRREALERQRERDGKKMTPAQKRDALFEEIGTAVAADDMDVVKNILLENPKLEFNVGAFHHVKNAVMENFSKEWMNIFAGRKLPLSNYEMVQSLCRRRNDDMLDYVLTMGGTNCGPFGSAMGLFTETYKLFNPKLSAIRRELLNYYEQRFDELIAQCDTPDFFEKTFGANTSVVADCVKMYSNDLPQKQKDRYASLENTADWNGVFRHIIEQKIKSSQMASVIAFCKAYPFANTQWNETLKSMSDEAKKFEDFIDTHWGDKSKPLGQTNLINIAIQSLNETKNGHYARHYTQMYEGYRKNNLSESYEIKGLAPLSLTEYQMFRHLGVGRNNFEKSYYFSGILPANAPKTFVHALLQTASSPVLVLLKNEKGQKMVEEALTNDLETLKKWSKEADVDMIGKVLKNCKGLKTWTDDVGNSIAHYLTVFRTEKTKTFGLMLARVNNDWYLQENAAGFSIKDLFKKNGATENMIVDMDKELLTRTLKDAGIRKSKKVEQAKKRRM